MGLSASAMQGLREEYMDTPVEIAEFSANGTRMSIAKERQEKLDYEEKYFTRLPASKIDTSRDSKTLPKHSPANWPAPPISASKRMENARVRARKKVLASRKDGRTDSIL